MVDLLQMTLLELTATLRARKASPVELMSAVIDRLEGPGAALNALAARREPDALMSDARDAEARILRGEGRPLEGIPLGVKDLEDAAELPTTRGSLLFRDVIATANSTQVARLKAAGAIVFGKTTSPEFGHTAITKNLVHGVTRSPWGDDRTPGGSSGGSAALVAAEVLPLVTASDGGGSIRIPASFCGAFGLKPSFGRVPKGPGESWDTIKTSVYGPLTKTVEDGAFVLDMTAGPHPLDPTSLPPPGLSFLEAARRAPTSLRIGYARDLGYAVVQSDVATSVDGAVRVLSDLGHHVEEVAGGPPDMGAEWGLLNGYELAGELDAFLPERTSDITRALVQAIDWAKGVTPAFWRETSKKRAAVIAWCASIFDRYDALVTPTVPYDPPAARGPLPSDTEGRAQPTAGVAAFTIPFNLSWHPAATVRAGYSKAGLPVGLQIVGPPHRDDLVLAIARAFEEAQPWHPRWPLRETR